MASRTSTRKTRKQLRKPKRRASSKRFEILLSAALAIPGLGITHLLAPNRAEAQSAADSATISLGYLEYQDHQKGVEGINVHSPTFYFKTPVGSRTEIEGGFTYDSVSGASGFNVAPDKPAPAPPVVAPTPAPQVLPPCRLFPVQAVSRASGSSHNSSGSSHGSSSGGSSSGGSSSLPICSNSSSSSGNSQSGGSTNSGEHEQENEQEDEQEHEGREDRAASRLAALASKISSGTLGSFEDERFAGDVKLTHYFDTYSLGAGVAISTENDYDSLAGVVDSRIWTPNKNTTFAFGVAANYDSITAVNDSSIDETKNGETFLLGVTQIINPISIIQSNLTFALENGYLSDPYQPNDNRPDTREAFAWLTRYNIYLEPTEGSLHLDYRLYSNSWGVLSHMLEAAWYQPVSSWLMLRPSLRYYTQSQADFYIYDPTADSVDAKNYSTDQRLSMFGGITVGLKLIANLGDGFSANLGIDYLTQSSDYALGSASSASKRDSLDAEFVYVGLTKKF